jgi:ATP-dependent RNA helicase RhlE
MNESTQSTQSTEYTEGIDKTFADLGLHPALLAALRDAGYDKPTPIQTQVIPIAMAGADVMGAAQTGTGKTAAFALPLLNRIAAHANTSTSPARHPVRALILTPTRELAIQVWESVRLYAKHLPIRSTVVYGGVNIDPQIAELRRGIEVVVATPGRLLDHMHNKSLSLGQVEMLVLDEADRMLDMGFMPDLKRILSALPSSRQNMLFSATFPEEIRKLADAFLHQPQMIQVARSNATAENVRQVVHPVHHERKRALLVHLITSRQLTQALVFVNTKLGANRLAHELNRASVHAVAIHGDKTQGERLAALEQFKAGAARVMVATDVAARGLDIEQLPHVINFDLPHVSEDYVHRIGRTGRAGASGEAISLVTEDELRYLRDIERLIKQSIPSEVVAGFGADAAAMPLPRPPSRARREEREPRSLDARPRTPRDTVPEEARVARPPRPARDTGDAADSAIPDSAPIRNRPTRAMPALFMPPRSGG